MYRRYGLLGIYKLIISLIYTKLFFPNAKIIRLPFDIRNSKNIKLGKNFTTGFGCRIDVNLNKKSSKKCIIIGDNVQINDNVHIGAIDSVKIGNDVLIASKVFITDHNHGKYNGLKSDSPLSVPVERELIGEPVIIENKVWIGEFVCVLPGVTIGEGSIIGCLSVVSKSIPAYSIAVGSPARVIKKYDFVKEEWVKV